MATPKPKRGLSQSQVLLVHGVRSGLEEKVCKDLRDKGVAYEYEAVKVPYITPAKPHTYTPDIILPNGIVVELKGHYIPEDRAKQLLVKKQNPDLDIRFVFSNSKSRITKRSQTTYADWCRKNGFVFADKEIPNEWTEEPPNERSLAALKKLRENK
ncbi:endonuclease [Ralstonia phage BOESR1]|uniref:Endonuclease n=1 Tax=Ralstonia phage BOESR1 TaxID=3034917 RepID=A0AA50F2R2_9CAUD|nr:endonuclease [Ralstonia phage BOESR1]WLW40587.1 endonuclease [Ralstonia phage BOESR1]